MIPRVVMFAGFGIVLLGVAAAPDAARLGAQTLGAPPTSAPDSATPPSGTAQDAEHDPVIVTTDSQDYCHTLERTIETRAPATFRNVRELEQEGAHLCDSGHVRPGIDRLRRALQLLKHS